MAFGALTSRGEAGVDGGLSVAVSPGTEIAIGELVVAICTSDNEATTDGASTDHDSVTDTDGHTWTKILEFTSTAGVALDGCTLSVWYAVTTAAIGTGDSVTFTSGASNDKVIAIASATIGIAEVEVDGWAAQAADGTVNDDIVLPGLTNVEHLLVAIQSQEHEAVITASVDGDYTFVDSRASATAGGPSDNVMHYYDYRVATLTSDTHTSDLQANEGVHALVAFNEGVPPPP